MFILTKEQAENADKYSQEGLGLYGEMLMENAGQAFSIALANHIKLNSKHRFHIFCGRGNNGGDGIVLARRLKQLGHKTRLIFVDGVDDFSAAAAYHFKVYCNCGFDYELFNLDDETVFNESNNNNIIIIDAIFGTGFHGEPNDQKAQIFKKINSSAATVVSLDVPSGVCVDEGHFKAAIKADLTLCVSQLKLSAFLMPASLNYGKIVVVEAGVVCSPEVARSCMKTWGLAEFKKTYVFKNSRANKWSGGRALFVGGHNTMPGAVILAAKACLGSGVGLLKLAVLNSLKNIIVANVPEATYANVQEKEGALSNFELSDGLDVVAAGPGLSRAACVRNVVIKVVEAQSAIVLDADALSFFDEEMFSLVKKRKFPTVLTPHEREMARLCGCSADFVASHRLELAKEKAMEWNCFLVLKGANTITTTPSGMQFVNLSGNEGLAKGGTGDLLTGIVCAMVAQCLGSKNELEVANAVCNAVFIHGLCANLLVKQGKDAVAITATDVLNCLNETFRKLRLGNIESCELEGNSLCF